MADSSELERVCVVCGDDVAGPGRACSELCTAFADALEAILLARPSPHGRSVRCLLASELGEAVLQRLLLPRPATCGTCGTALESDWRYCSFACRDAAGIAPPYGLDVGYAVALRADPCCYCGAPAEHFEHIESLRRGGDRGWTNITAACARCNRRKGTRSMLEFLLRA
jgi:predicted nucleic acid-binding Zn ribbon protein